jgi:hypothetical protein
MHRPVTKIARLGYKIEHLVYHPTHLRPNGRKRSSMRNMQQYKRMVVEAKAEVVCMAE